MRKILFLCVLVGIGFFVVGCGNKSVPKFSTSFTEGAPVFMKLRSH